MQQFFKSIDLGHTGTVNINNVFLHIMKHGQRHTLESLFFLECHF